jgi:ferredoxin
VKIIVDPKKCRGAGACAQACPEKAITLTDGVARIDEKKCDLDGICIAACPHEALSLFEDEA